MKIRLWVYSSSLLNKLTQRVRHLRAISKIVRGKIKAGVFAVPEVK